ncbi:50S ribosomal protein L23, partial [Candidatus Kaiserbacteria bacterium]|nr:50S ribosomal protein L23 [Candidatus Kaiserbacteria bacterium]
MALFRRTKKEEKKKEEKPEKAVNSAPPRDTSPAGDLSDVLRTPRITEKATSHSELGVYTFDIAANATKRSVSQAVAALYKVTPRKIRIVP